MPKRMFDTAHVKNLTPHTKTLRSGDGDSIDIMGNSEAEINRKFLLWQPPSRQVIRILSENVEAVDAPNQEPMADPIPPVTIEAATPVGEDAAALEVKAEENLEADTAAQPA